MITSSINGMVDLLNMIKPFHPFVEDIFENVTANLKFVGVIIQHCVYYVFEDK